MADRIETRLKNLGLTLPEPAKPVANYVPYTISGRLVVVSGQLPIRREGALPLKGKLGAGVSVENAQQAARECLLNVLAHLRVACGGDLDRVSRVLRLGGFIAATADFTDHATVMNGASDLAVEIFGDLGRHARSTIGVASLPADSPVEVEGLFEITTGGPLDSPVLA